MPGSTWVRKDGRIGGRFRWTTASGTKTATTTKSTQEAADAWLRQMEREADEGPPAHSGGLTVGAYLDEWLRDAVQPSVRQATYNKRSWAVNTHIKPALGRLMLSSLDARAIQALNARTASEGYAHETRLAIYVTLKTALKQAVRWNLIRRNPADLVDAPRDAGGLKDEIRHLTDAQARRLFVHAECSGSRWRNYYVAAVRTGLRPGEMLGLWWGDLNLEDDPGTLRVRRTLDTHSAPVFNPPKTPAARRTVALHFEAKGALLRQRAMLVGEGLPAGPDDLVFPSEAGTPMSSDNLRKRHLKPTLAKAGLPVLTLHELRHTHASIMLHEWRVPPAAVSRMMGHKSIAFTFDLYGHLVPSAESEIMASLNREQAPKGEVNNYAG